jgi:predicted nucleic-acid-binding protein
MASNLESLDTNILLRLAVNDIPEQRQKALKLLAKPNTTFYIDDQAITEAVYTLETSMKKSRQTILNNVTYIIDTPNTICNKTLFKDLLPFYLTHPKLSFNDCYLAAKSAAKQAEPLWTFDHKFALQSPAAKLVK